MGAMAKMMQGLDKKPKPRLHVNARVEAYGGEQAMPGVDTSYLRERLAECKVIVKKIQHELDTFVPEDAAAMVKKSLQEQLDNEKLEIQELRMRIKHAKERAGR